MPPGMARRSLRQPESKSRARACSRGIEESFQTTVARGRVNIFLKQFQSGTVNIAVPYFFFSKGVRWHQRKHSQAHRGDEAARPARKIARVACALTAASS